MEHTFANLMYDVCQILGVFREGSKQRDIRAYGSFWRHQEFFNQWVNDVIEIIDKEGVFSKEKRRVIFHNYEMFYNQVMGSPVFSRQTKEQTLKRYIRYAVPPLLALDIYKTFVPENGYAFYYHIHHFLLSQYCPQNENDAQDVFAGAKSYLRHYISELGFTHKENLYPVYESIKEIRKGNGQVSSLLVLKINECIKTYKGCLKDDDFRACEEKLNRLKIAYLSLNTLLAFERKTGLVNHLSCEYRYLRQEEEIHDSYYKTLSDYLYHSTGFDEEQLNCVVKEFFKKAIAPISVKIRKESRDDVLVLKHLVFNPHKSDLFTVSELLELTSNLMDSPDSVVLRPYFTLSKVIYNICIDDLPEAERIILNTSFSDLPLGYISAAFSILKIAINIRLHGKAIKNGVLLSDINNILAFQGIYCDYVFINTHARPPEFLMVADANNFTIIRAIKLYNEMILKTRHPYMLKTFSVRRQSIYGVLDEVENALRKINERLSASEGEIGSGELAEIIVSEKILTTRECHHNLVSYLDEFTLYNCICCIDYIIFYLKHPLEKLPHITKLAERSLESARKRTLIADAIRLTNEIEGREVLPLKGVRAKKNDMIFDRSRNFYKK